MDTSDLVFMLVFSGVAIVLALIAESNAEREDSEVRASDRNTSSTPNSYRTIHLSKMNVADYALAPDTCTPAGCIENLLRLSKHCDLTQEQSIEVAKDFIEALNLQLKGIWELIEIFEDGALRPTSAKALISDWIDVFQNNNHELWRNHLHQLKDNLLEMGIPVIDPYQSVPDKFLNVDPPHAIWRTATSAAKNKGICPDQDFVDGLPIPEKLVSEMGDISGLSLTPVLYHYDQWVPSEEEISALENLSFSITSNIDGEESVETVRLKQD